MFYQIKNMERIGILQQLNEIFIDALDNDDIRLTNETTASEVDGWDSLSHIELVVAVETHFNMRFTSKEIHSWKNVGELIDSIIKRL